MADRALQQQPPPSHDAPKRPMGAGAAEGDADVTQKRNNKKKRSGGGGAGGAPSAGDDVVQVNPGDYVRIVPFRKPQPDDAPADAVVLSKTDRAAQLQLSADRLTVTGAKGYRTARATHGTHQGCFYCEVTVAHLGATGHCRLGWSSKQSDVQAPVGYDAHGFGYRDLEGSKVHQALREPYGAPYAEGDVVGLLLLMPPGGRPMEQRMCQVVKYKGSLYHVEEGQEPAAPLHGSRVGFCLNGAFQGVAYSDLLEGTYYPSASLYTRPEQAEGASVTFNFGPDFKHPPPDVPEFPGARPCSDLVAWLAEAELARQLAEGPQAGAPPPADTAGAAAGAAAPAAAAAAAGGDP